MLDDQRHIVLHGYFNRPGVDYLGAFIRELAHLVISKMINDARSRNQFGIRRHNSFHIGVNLHFFGAQSGTEDYGACITAAPTQSIDLTLRRHPLETGHNHHLVAAQMG